MALRSFETEPPICPFNRCDMQSNHKIIGRGWDFEYDSTHEEIDYLQCLTCRLIFPRDIPSESALPIIYPPHYYAFNETETANPIVARVRGWVARTRGSPYYDLVSNEGAAVIDIGCGDGRLLDILRFSCPRDWQLHGIDWSEKAINRVNAKGYFGRSGDISRIDLSDWQGKFDLVLMHQLIEHVRNPREILKKVAGIIKTGGILSIETPDINCWDFQLLSNRYWSVYHIPRHFYIFDKVNFVDLARSAGFEVISTKSLINPVAWIHSIRSFCADRKFLRPFAKYFHHQNVLLLAIFTPLEILQTCLAGTSSNMQINLRKI